MADVRRRARSLSTGPPEDTLARRRRDPVEANARLTGSTAVVLFVLLAVEGVTILRIHRLLSLHVFVGMLLVPPVVIKVGSTGYRFLRYYTGSAPFRAKGPPPLVLRLLGPVLVALTGAVLASGIALLFVGPTWRPNVLFLHKASFVLWLGVMAIHVLGHLGDTVKLAPRDWIRRSRRDIAGAGARQWVLALSLVAGVLLGLAFLSRAGSWIPAVTHAGR
jgi:hypothetical protein